MEVPLVLLAAIALLVAVLMWSRRGQSSIGREPVALCMTRDGTSTHQRPDGQGAERRGAHRHRGHLTRASPVQLPRSSGIGGRPRRGATPARSGGLVLVVRPRPIARARACRSTSSRWPATTPHHPRGRGGPRPGFRPIGRCGTFGGCSPLSTGLPTHPVSNTCTTVSSVGYSTMSGAPSVPR